MRRSHKSSNGGKITAKKASTKATNKSTAAGKRDVDGCGEREASNSSTAYCSNASDGRYNVHEA